MPGVLSSPNHWIVVLTTLVVVFACVFLHYEVLGGAWRPLRMLGMHRRRRMLGLIVIILFTHIAEIWIFAIAYFLLATVGHLGSVVGLSSAAISEYAYFSAATYTTLGYGDIVPVGELRFMTGTEALTGLVLITWSASFAFLEMQRHWRIE